MPTRPILEDLKDRTLGDFRLLRKLGGGGMAEVYLAEQISLKRQVAVKVLKPELVADESYLRRFEHEAASAAALNHPNIVQVFAFGSADGLHFIAQEYVDGPTLSQYVARKGPPDASTALRIMRQVASALEAAGDAGIIHRDVKPDNVMINRKGEVKVADFGLAQLTEPDKRVDLTQVGITMGTPLYMSPEQLNGKPLDVRSDLYSFGVTCYHMLAGRPPFDGENVISLAVQHINQQPRPLTEVRPDLPPVVAEVVEKLMAKNPEERFRDAGSLLRHLRKISTNLKEHPESAATVTLADFGPDEQPSRAGRALGRFFSWNWRQHVRMAAPIALAAALIGAGVAYFQRPGSPLDAPSSLGTNGPPSRTTRVPREPSVEAQVLRAIRGGYDLHGWQAVVDYWEKDPDAALEVSRAKEQIALIYLGQRRLDEAQRLFEDLDQTAQSNPSLQANAKAGLAIVASIRGDYDRSNAIILDELARLNVQLEGRMAAYLREANSRNRRHRGGQGQDIENLLKSDLTETEEELLPLPAGGTP